MATFFKKYQSIIFALLILSLFGVAWLFPSIGIIFGVIFVLLSLSISSYIVISRYREAYLKGRLPRNVSMHNMRIEMVCIIIAMTIAGLLGWYLALVAAGYAGSALIRTVIGIGIGLLVGLVLGAILKKAINHFLKAAPGN